MLARNITIFRLPIDADHKNVFDFSDKTKATAQNYFNALRNKFQYEYVALKTANQPDVSLNIEKEMDICVNVPCDAKSNVFISEFISTFNYLGMSLTPFPESNDNDKSNCFVFYFITGWKIMNSIKQGKVNVNQPNFSVTVLFNLKWDAWANNLAQIQNQSNKMFFERKHIDDFKKNVDSIGQRWMGRNTLETSPIEPSRMKKIKDNRKMHKRESHTVIFARIFADEKVLKEKFKYFWDDEIKEYVPASATEYALGRQLMPSLICFYIPIEIVNTLTREKVDFDVKFLGRDGTFRGVPWRSNFKAIMEILGTYIKYIDSSVYMFEYDVTNTQVVVFKPSTFGLRIFGYDDPQAPMLPGPNESAPFVFVKVIDDGFESVRTTECVYFTRTQVPDKSSKLINDIKEFEPNFHYFPYNYLSITQLDEDHPLIPDYDNNVLYISEKMTGFSPALKIHSKNEDKLYFVKQKTQNIPIITDYYRSLIDTNGNNIIASLAMGGISLIKGDIMPSFSTFAKLADAKNRPSSFTNTSSNAFDNLEIADDIVFYKNIIRDEDEENYILNYLHLYGISYGKISTLENTRQNFDYQKTVGCEPQFIIDEQDRKDVAEIFNNGVRRWHLDTCYVNALLNCDTDYINLQNSLVESEV